MKRLMMLTLAVLLALGTVACNVSAMSDQLLDFAEKASDSKTVSDAGKLLDSILSDKAGDADAEPKEEPTAEPKEAPDSPAVETVEPAQPAPEPVQAAAEPVEGTLVYSPADELDLAFRYSNDAWTYSIGQSSVSVSDTGDVTDVTEVQLMSMSLADTTGIPETNAEALQQFISADTAGEMGFNFAEISDTTVDGFPAVLTEGSTEISGFTMTVRFAVWRSETRLYLCALVALDHTIDGARAVFENILDSFQTATQFLAAGGVVPEPTEEPEAVEPDPTAQPTEAPAAIGLEGVLLDEKNVKVTATGMTTGWLGPEINVLIENNTDQNLTFALRDTAVNGYMIDMYLSETVAAGMKSNSKISFSETELKAAGIETIAVMEFSFNVYNSDSWVDYLETDRIRVETDAAKDFEFKFDENGEVLYDKDGLKVIYQGTTEDWYYGTCLIMHLVNNSNREFTFSFENTSVNGFMMKNYSSRSVLPGKHSIVNLGFSDLEKSGIQKIETVQFNLQFMDENWDSFSSDPIKVTVK